MKRFVFLVILLSVFGASQCLGQEMSRAELDKRASNVYQQVFSPFCPGRSLNDCPSSKAHDLKMELREQLSNGESEDQVLESVFAKYGDKYRAIPRYVGFGKLVWWIPLLFLLFGAITVLRRATKGRASRNHTNESSTSIPLSKELEAQIRDELSGMD